MPGQHRRRLPLIRLLARLGWQRDPDLWTVPCRDPDGRRTWLLIRLTLSGITLTAAAPWPLYLTALEVARLRGAALDAIRTCSLLSDLDFDSDHAESSSPGRRAGEPVTRPGQAPAAREAVRIERIARPTVADLHARCQEPSP